VVGRAFTNTAPDRSTVEVADAPVVVPLGGTSVPDEAVAPPVVGKGPLEVGKGPLEVGKGPLEV
jgi:hypothetical protein